MHLVEHPVTFKRHSWWIKQVEHLICLKVLEMFQRKQLFGILVTQCRKAGVDWALLVTGVCAILPFQLPGRLECLQQSLSLLRAHAIMDICFSSGGKSIKLTNYLNVHCQQPRLLRTEDLPTHQGINMN